MDPELTKDVNNLYGLLIQLDVLELVRVHYAQFGNDAPPKLLQAAMTKVEKHLDKK